MRSFHFVLTILYAQLAVAAGFVQVRRKDEAAPLERRHRRSSRPVTHRISDFDSAKDIPVGIFSADSSISEGAYLLSATLCKYSHITATIVVPTISFPSSYTTDADLSVWIGFDGLDIDEASSYDAWFEMGIDLYYESGEVDAETWYEWYPDYEYVLSSFARLRSRFRILMPSL